MAAIDEILARIERQEAAQRLQRNEAEQGQCPSCGYRSDLDDFEVDSDSNDDDKEDWETQDGETTEDGGTTYDKSNMNKPQLTPEEKLARALIESAQRNSKQPQQVNRPSQLAKPAQRSQASSNPHAEENAALVLARAIAELRGEKR